MSDQPNQLLLFCGRRTGTGAVVTTARKHDGDLVTVPAPCPVCRPSATLRETWLAIVRLGRRLAP